MRAGEQAVAAKRRGLLPRLGNTQQAVPHASTPPHAMQLAPGRSFCHIFFLAASVAGWVK